MLVLIILGWLICGILTYGISLAYFQRTFPTIAQEMVREDMGISCIFGLFGPLGLVILFFFSGFAQCGIMFRNQRR
jgi:hypothetical protein